jgi:hypothetical protein
MSQFHFYCRQLVESPREIGISKFSFFFLRSVMETFGFCSSSFAVPIQQNHCPRTCLSTLASNTKQKIRQRSDTSFQHITLCFHYYFFPQNEPVPLTNLRSKSKTMTTTTTTPHQHCTLYYEDDCNYWEDMSTSHSTNLPQRGMFRMPKFEIASLKKVRQPQRQREQPPTPPVTDTPIEVSMESWNCTTQDDAFLEVTLERSFSADSSTSSICTASSTTTCSSLDDILNRTPISPTNSSSSSSSKRSHNGLPTHRRTKAFFY